MIVLTPPIDTATDMGNDPPGTAVVTRALLEESNLIQAGNGWLLLSVTDTALLAWASTGAVT